MERNVWEPYTAVRTEMVNGIPYVESTYLTKAINEIVRLQDQLEEIKNANIAKQKEQEKFDKLQDTLNQIMLKML